MFNSYLYPSRVGTRKALWTHILDYQSNIGKGIGLTQKPAGAQGRMQPFTCSLRAQPSARTPPACTPPHAARAQGPHAQSPARAAFRAQAPHAQPRRNLRAQPPARSPPRAGPPSSSSPPRRPPRAAPKRSPRRVSRPHAAPRSAHPHAAAHSHIHRYFGPARTPLRPLHVLRPFRDHFGTIFGTILDYFGSTLPRSCISQGSTLETFFASWRSIGRRPSCMRQ